MNWYERYSVEIGIILIMAAFVALPFVMMMTASYYLPTRVCEDKLYQGGYVEVCHTEPSPHSKRNP